MVALVCSRIRGKRWGGHNPRIRVCKEGDKSIRTLKDAHGGGEIVDPPGGTESSRQDGGGRDEIVGEGVVQVAL
jgi:hypothetical protein